MSIILLHRTLGFKLETTPYTAETLAASDYNVPAFDINYDPAIAIMARKIARGDLSKDVSIAGKRSIKVTFEVALAYSGSATTPPTYFKCFQACAMKQVIGGSSVTLTTDSTTTKTPATIEIVEKDEGSSPVQVVIKARGCMGDAKLVLNAVGDVIAVSFTFDGALVSIADRAFASILVPTGFDSSLPDAVLSASVKAFGETQTIDKVTINLGNKVELFSDPSKPEGYQGAHVVDRNPSVDMDPDFDLIANRGDYARMTGNTTGAMYIDVGSHLNLQAPALQLIKAYKTSERQGHVVNDHSFECKRSAGNDEFSITQS